MSEKPNRPPDGSKKAKGYEPPRLRKHGSLAELTRSGTGTTMEAGMGPPRAFQ